MFTESKKKIESCPDILRELKIGESTQFDGVKINTVNKAIQRLKATEGMNFGINSKGELLTVTRKQPVKNPGAEWVLKNLQVGEFYRRPIKTEKECLSMISAISEKVFNIMKDQSRGILTITRIE